MGPEHISDRVYKSWIYTNEELTNAYETNSEQDFDPEVLRSLIEHAILLVVIAIRFYKYLGKRYKRKWCIYRSCK